MSGRKIARAAWAAVLSGYFSLLCIGACGKPAAYGVRLVACTETAVTEAQAELCCVDTAREFGQDPAFCLSPRHDAGPGDASHE